MLFIISVICFIGVVLAPKAILTQKLFAIGLLDSIKGILFLILLLPVMGNLGSGAITMIILVASIIPIIVGFLYGEKITQKLNPNLKRTMYLVITILSAGISWYITASIANM